MAEKWAENGAEMPFFRCFRACALESISKIMGRKMHKQLKVLMLILFDKFF